MSLFYLIQGNSIATDSVRFQSALKRLYDSKIRPLCPCREPPIPMYIAKVNGRWIIKRMPNTGSDHNMECRSYEIPNELSGLGQVLDSVIKENSDNGVTVLRFDFSLSKRASKAISIGEPKEKSNIKTNGKKLSLRGLLHYLWEQAEFNKWSPAMTGKRNWYVIRKYLYDAAKDKTAKNVDLDTLLYIPEVFDLDQQQAIAQGRQLALNHLHEISKLQPFMLIVAEVKDIVSARFGFKMILKHLPDYPFLLNNDIYQQLYKRFAVELELWSANDNGHLMVIGTFGVNASGYAIFQEIALMMVTEQWIPFDNADEFALLTELTKTNRRFIKCQRYNLPSTVPTASVLLSDKDKAAIAIFVCPANASEAYRQDLQALTDNCGIKGYLWEPGNSEMPLALIL